MTSKKKNHFSPKPNCGADECYCGVSAKWIRKITRKKFLLNAERSKAGYVIHDTEWDKLKALFTRYGLDTASAEPPPQGFLMNIKNLRVNLQVQLPVISLLSLISFLTQLLVCA